MQQTLKPPVVTELIRQLSDRKVEGLRIYVRETQIDGGKVAAVQNVGVSLVLRCLLGSSKALGGFIRRSYSLAHFCSIPLTKDSFSLNFLWKYYQCNISSHVSRALDNSEQ